MDARHKAGHDDGEVCTRVIADRLAHHPHRGRAAVARPRAVRRRHRAGGRLARRFRAQPAPACTDQRRRQERGAGAARRACGADAGRSRAGHGRAPHGAAFQFGYAARQGLGLCARPRRGLLRRRAGGAGARRRPLHRRRRDCAGQRRLRAAAVRCGCKDGEGFAADPARARKQHHRHLQGRVRGRECGVRQGRACVQAAALAAPRRGAFDRGARHAGGGAPAPMAASPCMPRPRRRTTWRRR